jgi:hypothetical protein
VAPTLKSRCVALWRDRVNRQAVSGVSIVQFCDREEFGRSTFHAWKRLFQLEDASARLPVSPIPDRRLEPATGNQPPSRPATDQHAIRPAPPAFLPVTLRITGNGIDEPLPIEADLPNGIRLRIPTANAPLACRLIRAIAGAKTRSGGPR